MTVREILNDPALIWLLPGGVVVVLLLVWLCGGGDIKL